MGKYINASLKSVVVLLLLLHLCVVIINHFLFKTFGFDYAVYNFAFYDYAHLNISPVPIYGQDYPITFLQDHYSLTLMLLAPLYWLLNPLFGTYSLLIIQFLFIAAGCMATYKLISLRFGKELYGQLAAIVYLIIYARFSSYQNDCNLVIMGAAMVPVLWYFFYRKKYFYAMAVFVLLLVNREDFALGLGFFTLFLVTVSESKEQRRAALIMSAISFVVFVINMKVIIPALEDEHKKFTNFNYAALGQSPAEALRFMVFHPIETIKLFWLDGKGQVVNEKIKFYYLFLFSGGLLLLIRPKYLIPLLPLLAKKMFNDEGFRNGYESYYGIEILSIVPALVFYSIADFKSGRLRLALALPVLLSAFITTKIFIESSAEQRGDFNKFNPFRKSFYVTEGFSRKNISYMIDQIPDTAIVSASGRICAHLANRPRTYYYGAIADAQYILVFTKIDTWPMSREQMEKSIRDLVASGDWKIILADDDALLFQRKKAEESKLAQ